MRFLARTAILAATFVLPACDGDSPAEPATPLDQLRAATEKYAQVSAAEAAGYAVSGPCVASPGGGMGFHYVRQAAVDAVVSLDEPEVLLYAPNSAGTLQLVGVEYMVPAAAWDPTNSAAPKVMGQSFDDHRPEAARHGIPFPHYDLHVWVWKENPAGLHAPFNPTVSCPAGPPAAQHAH